MKTHEKWFAEYSKAYELYSDIVSGRDKDRKNATVTTERGEHIGFLVIWESKD